MPARAIQSNNASPPKGGAIGEFLEQIVFMVHWSPAFWRLSNFWVDSNPIQPICPIHLFDAVDKRELDPQVDPASPCWLNTSNALQ